MNISGKNDEKHKSERGENQKVLLHGLGFIALFHKTL